MKKMHAENTTSYRQLIKPIEAKNEEQPLGAAGVASGFQVEYAKRQIDPSMMIAIYYSSRRSL